MGYRLLKLAPGPYGTATLARFFARVGMLEPSPKPDPFQVAASAEAAPHRVVLRSFLAGQACRSSGAASG